MFKSIKNGINAITDYYNSVCADSSAKQIKNVTEITVEAIKSRLEKLPESGVLTVNIGETHNSSSHIIAQTDLIRALSKENIPFAFAFEQPSIKTSGTERNRGNLAFKERWLNPFASVSNTIRWQAISENKVPFAFIDSAMTRVNQEDSVLNLSDERTRQAVDTALTMSGMKKPKNLDNISTQSPLGMTVRNIHMKEACEELTHSIKGIKVLLMATGGEHTIDSTGKTHSLSSLYNKENNANYLCVPHGANDISSAEMKNIKSSGVDILDEAVIDEDRLYENFYRKQSITNSESGYLSHLLKYFDWNKYNNETDIAKNHLDAINISGKKPQNSDAQYVAYHDPRKIPLSNEAEPA